jgi:hypothetical protein
VAETVTGTIVESRGDVFVFQTDDGERIVFRLDEASDIEAHHLEGIVGSVVRIELTIDGPHNKATARQLASTYQHHR